MERYSCSIPVNSVPMTLFLPSVRMIFRFVQAIVPVAFFAFSSRALCFIRHETHSDGTSFDGQIIHWVFRIRTRKMMMKTEKFREEKQDKRNWRTLRHKYRRENCKKRERGAMKKKRSDFQDVEKLAETRKA